MIADKGIYFILFMVIAKINNGFYLIVLAAYPL